MSSYEFNQPGESDDSWEYTLSVPNDLRAVTVSRRTLRLILTLHGLIGLADAGELMAAELVSNAVRHTRGPADLRVCWSDGALRIGTWDADPEPPRPPDPLRLDPAGHLDLTGDAEAEAGRGLAIVGACAELWGWEPSVRAVGCANGASVRCNGNSQGKYVWCELGSVPTASTGAALGATA